MNTFTLMHILISLAGIAAGLVAVGSWMAGRSAAGWTWFFLVTTLLTSVTGFFFPFKGFTPAYAFGGLSIAVLALAIYALLGGQLKGRWRTVFVVSAVFALYLNFFVLVAQLFMKTPALQALAPTQQSPAFLISQLLVMGLFIVIGIAVSKNYRAA